MSCPLPPDILDLITDHLRDETKALKSCCTISKDWIYRTRRHLFDHVYFRHVGRHVNDWKKSFPDPTSSPAHHTRTLSIYSPEVITVADTDTLLTFCSVSRLNVDSTRGYDQQVCLLPLHGFSPNIKSLYLSFANLPSSVLFGIVCSFPLLEDLSLSCFRFGRRQEAFEALPTSPKLTGTLELRLKREVQFITSRLLGLPDGLHFRRIAVQWVVPGDIRSTMDLASRCSDTLESLEISSHLTDLSGTTPFDLSKATELKDLEFMCKEPGIKWITTVLRAAGIKKLQTITLVLPHYAVDAGFTSVLVQREWWDLDLLLVQFWTSRPLRLKFMYKRSDGLKYLEDNVARLLPESRGRGIVSLVNYIPGH